MVAVTLKLATSLDGRIATASGESRWITGELAREQVHKMRAEHDAVLVGIETALADDPRLTVRIDGVPEAHPVRVVLDSRQRLTPDLQLVTGAKTHTTILFTLAEPSADLRAAGVRVFKVAAEGGRVDLHAVLAVLAGEGVRSLLVEGGGQVAAGFLRAGLVDRIEWFRAPLLLGSEGRPGIGGLTHERLADFPRFKRVELISLGEDVWERYLRA